MLGVTIHYRNILSHVHRSVGRLSSSYSKCSFAFSTYSRFLLCFSVSFSRTVAVPELPVVKKSDGS